jgi:hypothetical protein
LKPIVNVGMAKLVLEFKKQGKCLKQHKNELSIHMVIFSKKNVNIERSLTFFDKAKGAKILPPMAITC